MHINPSMSGPVFLRRKKNSLVPGAVAFAGAELVVLGKTVVGVEEVWEVVFEVKCVIEVCVFMEDSTAGSSGTPSKVVTTVLLCYPSSYGMAVRM